MLEEIDFLGKQIERQKIYSALVSSVREELSLQAAERMRFRAYLLEGARQDDLISEELSAIVALISEELSSVSERDKSLASVQDELTKSQSSSRLSEPRKFKPSELYTYVRIDGSYGMGKMNQDTTDELPQAKAQTLKERLELGPTEWIYLLGLLLLFSGTWLSIGLGQALIGTGSILLGTAILNAIVIEFRPRQLPGR